MHTAAFERRFEHWRQIVRRLDARSPGAIGFGVFDEVGIAEGQAPVGEIIDGLFPADHAVAVVVEDQDDEVQVQAECGFHALREKQPKLGALMDASRDDVLACMDSPREHWPQIASTNPLERVNREIKRRADVIGIFPNDKAIVRLVGALMLETNDEWTVAQRYMSRETLARVTDNPTVRLSAVAT
jgi:hypothetical protein